MATFVAQIQFVILSIFSGLLGLTVLAAFGVALCRSGGWARLRNVCADRTECGPYQRRISSLLMWLCVVPLLCVLVVRGSTKNGGGTNEPHGRMERQIPSEPIMPEDVTRGYRISFEGECGVLSMPPGAVTNDLLRRRGGYDWAFRVAPEGWRFPYRDGCLTGVTVFARGEVRPDIGTLYFPMPVTNGVSLLPEARWSLLANGGASVFSHAVTDDGSLLLDWHNALVGREVNCPTNLQMELRADGGFAWRTDDGAQFYLPVLPFDWDGDGLENSVDPEPLVAHPFDCHGANAEWYSVVCSNVFTFAEEANTQSVSLPNEEEIFFQTNATEQAYYFVEVVAEQGPAPIYFMADRDSWLGSPVVIARSGETNHVPLLIGVEYAVTSTVPIFVSAPDAEYAAITTNDVDNYVVEWPLEIELVENLGGEGRSYSVAVTPFDPGGEFVWGVEASGGAALASAPMSGACGCWFGLGAFVSSSCSSSCGCGGCSAYGYFRFDGTRFDFSGGSCGCSDEDDQDDEPGNGGEPNTNFGPGVSVTVDNSTIVFEDEYSNDDDETMPRRSTWTCVTVEFAAGIADASCSVELKGGASRVVMHENSQGGSVCTSRRYNLKKNRTVMKKFYLEGVHASANADDVQIQAEISGGGSNSDSLNLTVYEVKLTPQDYISELLKNRHELGVGENIDIEVLPHGSFSVVSGLGSNSVDSVNLTGVTTHFAPFTAATYDLAFAIDEVSYATPMKTVLPQKVVVLEPPLAYYSEVTSNETGAIGMEILLRLSPTNVSFSKIETQETPSNAAIASGYFSEDRFDSWRYHNNENGAGRWIGGGFQIEDKAELGVCPQPWSDGVLIWYIPHKWRREGDTTSSGVEFGNPDTQEFGITSEGMSRVKKFNYQFQRMRNEIPQLPGGL